MGEGKGWPHSHHAQHIPNIPSMGGQSSQNNKPGAGTGRHFCEAGPGLAGTEGLKNQATAPLNVHQGHKAVPSLSSTWWRKCIYHLACPTGNQVTPCSGGAKKGGGRRWPRAQGNARFPGNTNAT